MQKHNLVNPISLMSCTSSKGVHVFFIYIPQVEVLTKGKLDVVGRGGYAMAKVSAPFWFSTQSVV
jgi:hypothetical protein